MPLKFALPVLTALIISGCAQTDAAEAPDTSAQKKEAAPMYCQTYFNSLLTGDSPQKPFSLVYDGKNCDLSQITGIAQSENGKEKITYEVIPGVIKITLELTRYADFPVIEYTPYIENISDHDSGIISEFSSLDFEAEDHAFFGEQKLKDKSFFGNSRLSIRYHLGSKANGTDFLAQKRDLFSRAGLNNLTLECASGWCSTDFLPFIGIDYEPDCGINLAIGWAGAWKFSAEKEIVNPMFGMGKTSRIKCGMKRAAFRLRPGEKVMQPGVLLHFRENKSIRDGQNEFRRFMIVHHCPRNRQGELIKPPLCLAFWGGLESDKQIERIKLVKEKQLPYEEVWIDAGWMGLPGPCPHFLEASPHFSNWVERVGSWEFNTYAHPQGLRPISAAAHDAGMRLLVWFETLRVHAKSGSEVLTKHPEWLLGQALVAQGKTSNYVFNIGIPEARQQLLDIITKIIEREGIDDYREDYNIDALPYWECSDEPERIGITEMKFVEGMYLYWEALRQRFPNLLIDNCASGGRRLDYKTASLSFPLCQSDFGCYLPYDEECVQLENLYLDDWLPLHGTLNWGMEDLYHAASALGGGLGDKIWQFNGRDPRPDHDYDLHRQILLWGKALRDMHLTGDVYPLVEAPENDWRLWNGQQIHDPDRGCGMVIVYRRRRSPDPEFQLRLIGLQPEARYAVEFFSGKTQTLTGRELAQLVVHLTEPRSFEIIKYRQISAQ